MAKKELLFRELETELSTLQEMIKKSDKRTNLFLSAETITIPSNVKLALINNNLLCATELIKQIREIKNKYDLR